MITPTIGRIPGLTNPREHRPPCCKDCRPHLRMASVANFVMLQCPEFMTHVKSSKCLLVLQFSEEH